jgi:NifU-like protein involved in Fe-S cluster formation
MTDLDQIYNTRILELAANIPRTTRLVDPDATATAHSKLCGSTVTVDVKMADGRVSDFGQTVKACLLGQAAASIVGREIIGTSALEIRAVAEAMRAMLKENGTPPTGKWADLAVLEPVRDYKARHTSTMLVFEAIMRALDDIAARSSGAAAAQPA